MVYDCWVRLSVIVRVSLSVMQSSWNVRRQHARWIPYLNVLNFYRLWISVASSYAVGPPARGFSRKPGGCEPPLGDILCSMNRRRFVTSSGAAAVALSSGLAPQRASTASPPALMKLGCQSAPTNETHLKYFARYGVRNLCGHPTIADGRLDATVDELNSMRGLA